MTRIFTNACAGEALHLKMRAENLRENVRTLWKWKDRNLDDAVQELNIDLPVYADALWKNPAFKKILPLEDDYTLLWAVFLKFGEPGTEEWDHEGLEGSNLRALPLEDFFLVLGALGSWQTLAFLEDYARNVRQENLLEAAESLHHAERNLKSGEKALAFVEEQRVLELGFGTKARVRI